MTPLPVDVCEGDCLEVLAAMPEACVDAVVTDPPYHLTSIVERFGAKGAAGAKSNGASGVYRRASAGFMGQTWDGGDVAFRPETWAAVRRVMRPGAYLVAFNHSRTFDRMAGAIRAAGFEVRDAILDLYDTGGAWSDFLDTLDPEQMKGLARALAGSDSPLLAWLYGTGFPKSHDVAKGIDRALGVEGGRGAPKSAAHAGWIDRGRMRGGAGAEGWQRPWMGDPDAVDAAARRYLPGSPEASAFEGWGTALKPAFEPILLARNPLAETSIARQCLATGTGALNIDEARIPMSGADAAKINSAHAGMDPESYQRAPVHSLNLSVKPIGLKPASAHDGGRWPANVVLDGSREVVARFPVDPEGPVSRFFYCGKADEADRRGSDHPTVKPQGLMRWLVRLVSRRGATVLDPFAGSGATGWAAAVEGRRAVLVERDPKFAAHLRAVIAAGGAAPAATDPAAPAPAQPSLFGDPT